MPTRTLSLTLVCFLFATTGAWSQDLAGARKLFKAAAKSDDAERQKAAIDAMVATGDIKALKDFEKTIDKVEKSHARLAKKIEKMGGKRAGIWKSIDKQADKGRPITRGSITQQERKESALRGEMRKLFDEMDGLEVWHGALVDGYGRLLESLPGADRAAAILELANQVDKARSKPEKVRHIHVLGRTNAGEARDALIEVALRNADPELRVSAIDSLASRGEEAGLEPIVKGLEDDSWIVQVTAARGLRNIPSTKSIQPLIDALAKADGRMVEEIQGALEDLTGVTFFNNHSLWKSWWKENEKTIAKTLADLDAESADQRGLGVATVAESGLLAGALKILRTHGFGPRSSLWRAGRKSKLDDAAMKELDAVGKAVSKARKNVRQRNATRLLMKPFRSEKEFPRRLVYVRMLGPVKTDTVLRILRVFAGPRDVHDPKERKPYGEEDRARLRKTAVQALGQQDDDRAVDALRDILDDTAVPSDVKSEAITSLRHIRRKSSIQTLIRLLNDFEGDHKKAIVGALEDLSGQKHGEDYKAWKEWWGAAKDDFKVDGIDEKKKDRNDGKRGGGTTFYGIETGSKHLVYIIDVSGSMMTPDAGGETRLNVARKELIQSIRSLPKDATFNIIFYNSTYKVWKKKMVVADVRNKASAIEWAEGVQAMGWTNIFDPLEHAFKLAGRGTHDRRYGITLDTIFFLSDGQPNRGRIIDPREILKEITRMNELKKVKIHTVGVGKDHNGQFMARLAEITEGSYVSKE